MPRVCLTPRQRAMKHIEKVQEMILGRKEMLGYSWAYIASEMGLPRKTLEDRFKKNLLRGEEWLMLFEILEVTRDDLERVFR